MKKNVKSILLIIMTVCFLTSITSSGVYGAETTRLYGDVNNDGEISLHDAVLVLYHMAYQDSKLGTEDVKYADADKDGTITISDAYAIFNCAIDNGPGINYENINTNGTVWIASDSISAGVGGGTVGWGYVFSDYLTDEAVVHTTGVAGTTSMSFTLEKNYQEIINNIKAGDVLFICFGHNDNKGGLYYASPTRPTSTLYSYKYNLKNFYIDMALRKGAQPIVLTCFVRYYNEEAMKDPANQYHYYHVQAAKELVEDYKEQGIDIPLIDIFDMSYKQFLYMGSEEAHNLYHKNDSIHLSETGARFLSQLILTEVKEKGWDFGKYINNDALTDPRSYPH